MRLVPLISTVEQPKPKKKAQSTTGKNQNTRLFSKPETKIQCATKLSFYLISEKPSLLYYFLFKTHTSCIGEGN